MLFLPLISDSYGARKLLFGLIGASLGVLAGIASYRYIERPFLAMKVRVDQIGRTRTVRSGEVP
ncbi:MAG: hypothetical protein M5U19_16850 [Microthrixaceae bacterium]|nr:hypothetical protein [Microthrixaceae bacterium]